MMHHDSAMLENCQYVRCLVIDFSRAFDVVNHVILLDKLSKLNLPNYIVNLIVSFLTDRTQAVKVGDKISCQQFINRGIVQGSGVGPTSYVVMESDLKPLSSVNLLCKFADDTNLLVPANPVLINIHTCTINGFIICISKIQHEVDYSGRM